MKLDDIKKIIGDGIKKCRITHNDGTKEDKRLFISTMGCLCYCGKNMRKRGYVIDEREYSQWESVTPITSNVDIAKRMAKRANDALSMLYNSVLWGDIRKEIEEFLKLTYDEVNNDFANGDLYELRRSGKYPWLKSYQVFDAFKANKCWKTPNYGSKFIRETVSNSLVSAFSDKKEYQYRWRNGYDNSISTAMGNDGIQRAWYSEEYKDCGNGHYYLLFDENHAIFYEDD